MVFILNNLSSFFRKRWYHYNAEQKIINSSSRIHLMFIPSDEYLDLFRMYLNHILCVTKIYNLKLSRNIYIGKLVQIIHLLNDLDSIKIHSLSLYQQEDLCEDVEIFSSIKNKNRITKVCLKKMSEIQEIFFLMKICPYMEYLKVNSINNMNVELFLWKILKKINIECNHRLCLLCFCVPTIDDELIKKLRQMIQVKKLLIDYEIKRVCDYVYLYWK